MPQLFFSMRPKLRVGQKLIKSRTVRQLSGDLSDLEKELAKSNDVLFGLSGLSWARPDVEAVWHARAHRELLFADHLSPTNPNNLPRATCRVAQRYPEHTAKVDRLKEERRLLVGRIMARSPQFEHELTRAPFEWSLAFPGHNIPWSEPETFNPYHYLDTTEFPYPNPLFGWDSCIAEGSEDEVDFTPQYRDVFPWFWNDVDEWKVAQLDADLRDTIPWDGSWSAYEYKAKPGDIHPNSAFGTVLARVRRARERREVIASTVIAKEDRGHQLGLWEDERAVSLPTDVRPASPDAAGPTDASAQPHRVERVGTP